MPEVGGTQLAFGVAGVAGLVTTAFAFAELRPRGWAAAFRRVVALGSPRRA
jgi:hypothetical protein